MFLLGMCEVPVFFMVFPLRPTRLVEGVTGGCYGMWSCTFYSVLFEDSCSFRMCDKLGAPWPCTLSLVGDSGRVQLWYVLVYACIIPLLWDYLGFNLLQQKACGDCEMSHRL
jgi:hypothetical protein